MSLPTVFIIRFFQLVHVRNFKAAEIILHRIERNIRKGEWQRGYFTALNGILVGLRSGDKRLFVNNMTNPKEYREEFLRHSQSRFHADFDRGFFTAWVDFLKGSD
jgi:hypothetical protein